MAISKEKLKFDKFEVVVDAENLRFNEDTLSTYIQNEGGHYDNFGGYLALAERNLQNKESMHDKLFCERFEEAKENGASDKLSEAKAKKDPDVVEMRNDVIEARYIVNRLKNHLKAWDKNHDNAQSMGHMLRKQMDKLNSDITGPHGWQGSRLDHDVNETVKNSSEGGGFAETLGAENLF
jgi:hypothetical protein